MGSDVLEQRLGLGVMFCPQLLNARRFALTVVPSFFRGKFKWWGSRHKRQGFDQQFCREAPVEGRLILKEARVSPPHTHPQSHSRPNHSALRSGHRTQFFPTNYLLVVPSRAKCVPCDQCRQSISDSPNTTTPLRRQYADLTLRAPNYIYRFPRDRQTTHPHRGWQCRRDHKDARIPLLSHGSQ